MPLSLAAWAALVMAAMRLSEMLPRFAIRAWAVTTISATSAGCSAMMGRAPKAKRPLAQSRMEMWLVMQWISGCSV